MRLCNVCEDEARYYLSIHDFDFKEALQEHKSDLEWEREHNEKLSKKKRKKQIDNFLDENPRVMNILRYLSFCIPNNINSRKKNKDVELDLIQDDVIEYDSDY
ncbi:predicted protein [Naegleria gruberi]|uniref:Predicted protein n=1 Tax=Naegleria gruberi TaxID=5762 RepID=D2W6J2_NAEGR|nr:uncharacterized protein NAEGRDRAFT_77036 [Naegleria gruberi]EFC35310.1 predicted protein [Naegleria gruberi]|eukprot:XP_002668054.1 predicted protein [Naegleria gruberi strain NEG-M]